MSNLRVELCNVAPQLSIGCLQCAVLRLQRRRVFPQFDVGVLQVLVLDLEERILGLDLFDLCLQSFRVLLRFTQLLDFCIVPLQTLELMLKVKLTVRLAQNRRHSQLDLKPTAQVGAAASRQEMVRCLKNRPSLGTRVVNDGVQSSMDLSNLSRCV